MKLYISLFCVKIVRLFRKVFLKLLNFFYKIYGDTILTHYYEIEK